MSTNGINKENISILIIDDEEDIRDIFEEVLRRDGYTKTSSVGNGARALEISENEFINVALIDLNLPDIDGLELITKLRINNPDTEFIIVTGFGSIDTAKKALQIDVGSYLEKPISQANLTRTINEVVEKQHLKLKNQEFLKDLEVANKEIRFLNNLLMNNVDELNQSLLLTMVQIEKLNPSPEQTKVLQLFQESIRKNARLTRNIKRLQKIQQNNEEDFKPINLSQVFSNAINRLKEDYSNTKFECKCDLTEKREVLADNNLTHLIVEILSLAILNDPSPKIKIAIDFEQIEKDDKKYWNMHFNSFLAKIVYEQRNIKHPSDLKVSITDHSFQDLGPFLINELIRKYNGFVSSKSNDDDRNQVEIALEMIK